MLTKLDREGHDCSVSHTPTASIGFRSERGPILISLMLATGLVAIDSTIVATSVQSIVRDLGGFHLFPWLFSIYLLAQAVVTPICGKLSDVLGRKPIMLTGIGLFLVASALGGAAWSMPTLIAARALQGIGAGAVQSMAMTIAGDIYTVAERAAVTGYLSSVWAISAIAGPSLGGFFSQYVTWRWIFYINVPLCLLAAWMLTRSFAEGVERRYQRLDYVGTALITAGLSALILSMLEGGQSWDWVSIPGVLLPVAGIVMLVVFVLVEKRASDPVLPLWVFSRRVLVAPSLAAFCIGAVTLGLTSYIPTFVQGSLGFGPLAAGFTLAPLSIGWPVFSAVAGRVYLRFGFRTTALIGALVVTAGTVSTLTLDEGSSVLTVAAMCLVIGCGMGLVASPTLIAAQASVGWSTRGVVTGTNMFSRSIGSSLGMAIFGAMANTVAFATADQPTAPEMALSTHRVLLSVLVMSACLAGAVLAMPGGRDTSQVQD